MRVDRNLPEGIRPPRSSAHTHPHGPYLKERTGLS